MRNSTAWIVPTIARPSRLRPQMQPDDVAAVNSPAGSRYNDWSKCNFSADSTRVKQKLAPLPGLLSAQTVPP